MEFKRINDENVKAVKLGTGPSKAVRGANLFEKPYGNIFLLAKKNSGKTTCLFHILKKCASRKTKLVFIVSTIYKDKIYEKIIEYFEKKGNPIEICTEIVADELNANLEMPDDDTDDAEPSKKGPYICYGSDNDEPEKKKKKRKWVDKYLSPKIIFIVDDQGLSMRQKCLEQLIVKNRHYLCKIILAGQHLNHLTPLERSNLDYAIIFKGQPLKKLETAYRDLTLSTPINKFIDIYHEATAPDYSFLYIDICAEKYRQNFSHEIIM